MRTTRNRLRELEKEFNERQLRGQDTTLLEGVMLYLLRIRRGEERMRTDTLGRPYARVADVVVGTILEADGGFDCLTSGGRHRVREDAGELYVECRCGRHHLKPVDDGETYVGLYVAEGEDETLCARSSN